MQVGREKREVEPGDLIHIPPNTVHSIAPVGANVPMRALAFAASFMPPGGSGPEAEKAELPSKSALSPFPRAGLCRAVERRAAICGAVFTCEDVMKPGCTLIAYLHAKPEKREELL